MSLRKLVLLGVALVAMIAGVTIALLLPSHSSDAHDSGAGGMVAIFAAVLAAITTSFSARRRRRGCGRDRADQW